MIGTWSWLIMYSMMLDGSPRAGKSASQSFSAWNCRKLFSPSSIQVHWRSSELTTIGK